jgi:hypothetical protein
MPEEAKRKKVETKNPPFCRDIQQEVGIILVGAVSTFSSLVRFWGRGAKNVILKMGGTLPPMGAFVNPEFSSLQ